ncbi:MAG: endonuclease/exonuclease/phosphatase family protein [Clostridia bacterium]|nr:endonuclease/exonuclease/phosphatase family protein [Clostridia bacterium]
MKNRTKIVVCLLALLLCILPFAGCNKTGDDGINTNDTQTTTGGEELTPPGDALNLIKDGVSDYVIVRSQTAKQWEVDMAVLFRDSILAITGINLPIKDDYENASTGETRQAKEIVIGQTNREDEYTVDYTELGVGYTAFVAEHRLVITAGSETGLFLAIKNFFDNFYAVDIEEDTLKKLDFTDLEVSTRYKIKQTFTSAQIPFIDAKFTDYDLIYTGNDYMQARLAVVIADALESASGITVNRKSLANPDETSFVMKQDASLTSGDWKISVAGKTISLSAGDYYGFTGIAAYLKDNMNYGHYKFADGFNATGNYATGVTSVTASNAYAYDRAGENRVMFYNVLWGNTVNSMSTPAAERNVLQAEMIAQYLPDVLGLQEFDDTKRSGAGESNLVTLLAALNYEETLSPSVGNSINVNCTPLFYNTTTTTLVKSEYYWYSAQQENIGDQDQSSKALTWGVFESKKTGDRYIVVSTHMCTLDDNVRQAQAEEASALIESLVATYACPIFIGGDYNGTREAKNYKHFTETEGYLDVMDEATISSNVYTHHATPSYDETLAMMQPNDNAVENTNSIDHILVTNEEGVTLNLYGVVVDECTLSASDHFPIFVDFSIEMEADDAEWSDIY